MEKEIWKEIVGYEGLYIISNMGKVRSVDREGVFSTSKGTIYKRKTKGKIIATRDNNCGYKLVTLWHTQVMKTFSLHRLVCLSFLGKPMGLHVNHIDGNKANNNLSNLEYCTPSENVRHAFKIGLRKTRKGEESNFAKLTDREVKEIRDCRKDGISCRDIALKYGISTGYVYNLINLKYRV